MAFGWRWGMWAPGLIGCVVGLGVLAAVRDRPQDSGFPPVDSKAEAAAAKVGARLPAARLRSCCLQAVSEPLQPVQLAA
jgi:sugar phosphate permease